MVKYFGDVPVYRLSPERYEAEFEEYLARGYKGPAAADLREWHDRDHGAKLNYESRVRDRYGGGWQFNEIVGFIRLHFLGSQVRGEWWRVKAKRLVRTRRKMFEWRHWKLAYESEIPEGATNTEVFEIILEYLNRCRQELKGLYVDAELFESVGRFVDWNAFRQDA